MATRSLQNDQIAGQIEFRFAEFFSEIEAAKGIAAGFLDKGASSVLTALSKSLEQIRKQPFTTPNDWVIHGHSPIRTTATKNYEPGGSGTHKVFGEITSIWRIAPSDPDATKSNPAKTFRLVGNASVKIKIMNSKRPQGKALAMWRVELGAPDSPGCFFHTQILGEAKQAPFPKTLSVPRLPALIFTPMAALEFVIGELFQEKWNKHSARETPEMKTWRGIQQRRLQRLFMWKCKKIEDCTGSPWTVLKLAKPAADLFAQTAGAE